MYKIAITGTKGKTTIVRLLDQLLLKNKEKTLRVDNDGWSINGKLRGGVDDSNKIFGLIPSVCPGKFLLDAKNIDVAIMEAAVGSSGSAGLGYRYHNIGLLTNIYRDHISDTGRLKNRNDILKAKSFIYSRIAPDGFAIGNVDEPYVQKALNYIPKKRGVTFIPYAIKYDRFDLSEHLKSGGKAVGLEDNFIVFYNGKQKKRILDVTIPGFTFSGQFIPSVTNLMAVVAISLVYYKWKLPKGYASWINEYMPDEKGARLVYKEIKGRKVLIDFAHEEESLKQVLKLGKKIGKRSLCVLRIAPDRSNSRITEIAKKINHLADGFYVWDKVDGKYRKDYVNTVTRQTRKVGEVSKIVTKELLKKNKNVHQIILEDEAISVAINNSEKGDCLIFISGDDKERTLNYVKKHFRNL